MVGTTAPPSTHPLTREEILRRFAVQAISAACAASIAEAATIPIDTAKVRLQIQGQHGKVEKPYTGMGNALVRIGREEGLSRGLFKGLSAGIMRQLFFGTTRIALYEPVRNFYMKKFTSNEDKNVKPPFIVKVAAGLTTGAIAICFGQPADVIKIRFQAEGRLPPGVKPRYKSLRDAIVQIPRQDGIKGLWRGLVPNILRNSVINSAELATYDQIKQTLLSTGLLNDNVLCHLCSAFMAGFCATVCGSPFDVVKTRIMNRPVGKDGQLLYRGAFHAFGKIFVQEGPLAFYKGFVPNFMRIGTWNCVMFLAYEQVQRIIFSQVKK